MTMTRNLIAVIGCVFALGTAQAANEPAGGASKAPTAQQAKMAACNHEAGEKSLKGDERKKFMSTCLSAKKPTQQDKMKSCNKDASDQSLKGDERKKFMSDCLKA